jgi:hypothetical protein
MQDNSNYVRRLPRWSAASKEIGSNTSIFVSSLMQTMPNSSTATRRRSYIPGNQYGKFSSRYFQPKLSYAFNFKCPSITVDTAFSASLVAFHLAYSVPLDRRHRSSNSREKQYYSKQRPLQFNELHMVRRIALYVKFLVDVSYTNFSVFSHPKGDTTASRNKPRYTVGRGDGLYNAQASQ